MTEYADDTERMEQDRESKEAERKSKKEMTVREMLRCPTWDCDGGPEVTSGGRVPGGELWKVGCPKCGGWYSQFLIPDGSDIDPYVKGTEIWLEWRKEMGH